MSETLTPIKAIRAYCLGCMCGSSNEVRLCPIKKCELYLYRFGTNPNIKPKEYTDEQRAQFRENARRLNQLKKKRAAQGINTSTSLNELPATGVAPSKNVKKED